MFPTRRPSKSSVGSAILVKIRCVLIYDRYDYEVAIGLQRFWKTNEKDTGVNHVQKAFRPGFSLALGFPQCV